MERSTQENAMVEGLVLVVFGLLFGSCAIFGAHTGGDRCFGPRGYRTLLIASTLMLFEAVALVGLGAATTARALWQ